MKYLIFNGALNIVLTIFIIFSIQKHSVHPKYGEYEQKLYRCYPWDACGPDTSEGENTCKHSKSLEK